MLQGERLKVNFSSTAHLTTCPNSTSEPVAISHEARSDLGDPDGSTDSTCAHDVTGGGPCVGPPGGTETTGQFNFSDVPLLSLHGTVSTPSGDPSLIFQILYFFTLGPPGPLFL